VRGLSSLTLVFALLSLVFLVLLAFLRTPFPFYSLLSWQDVLDLLTPLVLIPLYWLLFRRGSGGRSSLTADIAFLVFASVWVLGHGLHLSANSIDNLAEGLARRRELNITGNSLHRLIYFFDERLSHPVWHLGMLGLAGLLIRSEAGNDSEATTVWWSAAVAGVVYGFTYFCIFLEGQTVFLGLPFAAIVSPLTLIRGRRALGQRPLAAFFGIACLVALLLFIGWGLYWRGFPQFTDVGLI
jgi:hypothetical protein